MPRSSTCPSRVFPEVTAAMMSGTPGGIVLSMCAGVVPLDLARETVDDQQLVAGNDGREQERHRLAVFAAGSAERAQRAATNHAPSLARDGDTWSGQCADPRLDERPAVSGATGGLSANAVSAGRLRGLAARSRRNVDRRKTRTSGW